MNKRIFLLVALALLVACVGFVTVRAQVPTPAPQVAATAPVPQAAPAPQAAQKPTTPPPPPGPPAPTQMVRPPSVETFSNNVRVDVTITDQGATGAPIRKSMSVTAMAGLRGSSSVRSGVNIPTPQTIYGAVASGGVNTIPITTYQYRTMGLSLDIRDIVLRGDFIRLILTVEYTPLDENQKLGTPVTTPVSYSNFSQSFDLVLENGKPIVAAVTSDPVPSRNRTLSVEVKATILK